MLIPLDNMIAVVGMPIYHSQQFESISNLLKPLLDNSSIVLEKLFWIS